MNEQQIRQIVRNEIIKQKYQSGTPAVYPHRHDGISSPKISSSSINRNNKYAFARNYPTSFTETFPANNPTSITFNGVLEGSDIIIGVCEFGIGFAGTSTVPGDTGLKQSSTIYASIGIDLNLEDPGTSTFLTFTDSFFNYPAVGTALIVESFTSKSVTIKFTSTYEGNPNLIGSFMIT